MAEDGRRTVLASCPSNEAYIVSRAEGTCAPFLDEVFGAWCGVAHSDAVPAVRLPLDEAFARAKQRLAEAAAPNVPLIAGTNVWPP